MHQPGPVAAFEDDCWKSPSTVALGPDADTTKKSTDMRGKSAAGSASMPHGSTRQPVGGPAADNSQDMLAATASRARRRRLSEHGCECCWLGLSNSTNNSPVDSTADLHTRLPLIEEARSCLVDNSSGAHSMPPLAGNSARFISPFAGLTLNIEQQQPEQPLQEHSFSADKQNILQEGRAASGLGLTPDAQLIDSDGLPVPVFAVVSVKQCKPAA